MVASELQEAGGDIGRERRKYPRRIRNYEAVLLSLTGEPLLRGRIVDLSKGGAKLIGSPHPPRGPAPQGRNRSCQIESERSLTHATGFDW